MERNGELSIMQRILSRVPGLQNSRLTTEQTAPCLKFRCAKPLQMVSSYVFWRRGNT